MRYCTYHAVRSIGDGIGILGVFEVFEAFCFLSARVVIIIIIIILVATSADEGDTSGSGTVDEGGCRALEVTSGVAIVFADDIEAVVIVVDLELSGFGCGTFSAVVFLVILVISMFFLVRCLGI